MLELAIELGVLMDAPVWLSHRGKNWCASIEKDPGSPGGLQRTIWTKAKGEFYVVPKGLKLGTSLEFGADSDSGTPKRDRWYGYVIEVTDKKLVLCKCVTAAGAIMAGKNFREQPLPDLFAVWWEKHVATNEITRGNYSFEFLRVTAEAAWRANVR